MQAGRSIPPASLAEDPPMLTLWLYPKDPTEDRMMKSVIDRLPAGKDRGLLLVGTGMAALMAGSKVVGLSLFAKGVADIETAWREAHPEFQGGLKERWAEAVTFYESTHRDPTNRALHMVGIPLILGGTIGLVAAPSYTPPWWVAAGAFGAGWALNIVGHAKYEKNRPAFADDPLSFIAGPVWDLQQMRTVRSGKSAIHAA